MHAVDGTTNVSACRPSPQHWGVAALLVGFLSLTGCTASPPAAPDAPARVMLDAGGVPIPPPHSGPPRLLKTSELSDAEKRFGISPEQTAGLTYQPDVVLLRSGVNAIRSLSDDGLVWTLDPRAEGIDGIQPGKVLLLSTKAAGRVLAVTRANTGVEVVLGPADITEIVREGSFSIDQPVDLTQALQMALPASFDPVRPVAPIVANALRPDTQGFIISPARFVQQAEEHDFRVIPMASVKGVGAELRSKPGGVLMVAQILFRLEAPNLNVRLNIQPAGVVSALVELKGAAGIEVAFEAASPGPNARNINADRPAPVDLFIPINGLGVPLAVHVRQVFRRADRVYVNGHGKGARLLCVVRRDPRRVQWRQVHRRWPNRFWQDGDVTAEPEWRGVWPGRYCFYPSSQRHGWRRRRRIRRRSIRLQQQLDHRSERLGTQPAPHPGVPARNGVYGGGRRRGLPHPGNRCESDQQHPSLLQDHRADQGLRRRLDRSRDVGEYRLVLAEDARLRQLTPFTNARHPATIAICG